MGNNPNQKHNPPSQPNQPHTADDLREWQIGTIHQQSSIKTKENKYWRMLRTAQTKSLSQAFKENLIDCYQIVVPVSGHTILHQSIILDRREIFRLCEVYGANWEQKDINGVTPLMKAAALNRTYFIQKLLQKGVNKQAKDARGFDAYKYAQFYDNYEAMDMINEVQ